MKNKAILAFFIIILLLLGYFLYGRLFGDGSKTEVAGNATVSDEADFLKSVGKLKTIKIDSSFFESDSFQFFTDLTPEIVLPEEFGRKNPFLPI